MSTATRTLISETTAGIDRPGQTMTLEQVVKVGKVKIRLYVRLDNYENQSVIASYVWTPNAGWQQCIQILGTDPLVTQGGVTPYSPSATSKRVLLDALANVLLDRTTQVTG